MQLDYETKLRMVKAGLAVPGMRAEGADAARNITSKLEAAGVYPTGRKPDSLGQREPQCTRLGDTCNVSSPLSPVPILLLAFFAYSLGKRSFDVEDEEWVERLERRAERSRTRRLERQRDLAKRLQPLQNTFGWSLIGAEGLPTTLAYAFLVLAAVVQLALALALTSPLPEDISAWLS